MTRKVFWEDPYLARLETRIAGVDGPYVTLEATIAYAFAGGQERDHGTIAGQQIRDARREGREIVYALDPSHGLLPGQAALVEIDWERRYRLMRLHFAAELVLELAFRRWPGIEKIGAHIAADKARIDFAWPESLAPELAALNAQAAELVGADHLIESAFSDRERERRYWAIAGFARVACGGTHLRRSGEVGALALKRKNVGRGKERIEIALA